MCSLCTLNNTMFAETMSLQENKCFVKWNNTSDQMNIAWLNINWMPRQQIFLLLVTHNSVFEEVLKGGQ